MALPFLIMGSVCFSVVAQLLLKQASMNAARNSMSSIAFMKAMLLAIPSWFGLFSFAASLGLWVLVLAKMPVSKAYPFVAIGIVITSMAGVFVYGESMTVLKFIAILIIASGVALLATC